MLAVLASTAGGFVALSRAFRDRTDGTATQIPGNGLIAFSATSEGGQHLFLVEPDGTGLRQITHGDAGDMYPAWSSDGRQIVFMRQDLLSSRLIVMNVQSGETDPITPTDVYVSRPTWSPDGELIAFAGFERGQVDETQDVVSGIWVVRPDGSGLRRLTDQRLTGTVGPMWSPDGSAIAFTSAIGQNDRDQDLTDVYMIGRDGSGFRNLTETPAVERNEIAIGWVANDTTLIAESPDGVTGTPGISMEMSRWFEMRIDGAIERIVLEAPANAPELLDAPSISPDGRFVLFNDANGAVWFMDLASKVFTRVTDGPGAGAAWQPVPAASEPEPSPTSEPAESPSPEPAGHDIGLPFRLCHVQSLGGLDFLGDGTNGKAWTGTRILEDGTCPTTYDDPYGVAVDYTGDGVADSWSGETIEYCGGCEPWKAMDLNGDGRKELMVIVDYFSIMHYGVYTFLDVDGRREIEPFRIGEPGHPEHELDPGKPFTFWVGGDAGLSDWFYCETLPEFWLTGTESPIDPAPGAMKTVHRTHVSLMTDGIAHILFADTYTVPAEAHLELPYTSPYHSDPDCGIGVRPG